MTIVDISVRFCQQAAPAGFLRPGGHQPPIGSGGLPFGRAFWARMTVLAVQETGKHGEQHGHNLLLVSYHG